MNYIKVDGTKATIQIYDRIGVDANGRGTDYSECASKIADLVNSGLYVTVRVCSGGGNLMMALPIVAAIREYKVKTVVDGLAASSASLIALAGEKVSIVDYGAILIHNPFDPSNPNNPTVEMMRKMCVEYYVQRTKLSEQEIVEMMNAEAMMDAETSYVFGFRDEVIATKKVVKLDAQQDVEALYEICNEILKNNNNEMTENVENKTPEVKPEMTQPETPAQVEDVAKVDEPEAPEASHEKEKEDVVNVENYQDALSQIESYKAAISAHLAEIESYKNSVLTLENEVKTLKQAALDKEINDVLNEATKTGKIKSDMIDKWREVAQFNLGTCKELLSAMTPGKNVDVTEKLGGITNMATKRVPLSELAQTNPKEFEDLYKNRQDEYKARYFEEYGVNLK